jgi:hypothetical protein
MSINVSKTKSMPISTRQKIQSCPTKQFSLYLNNEPIEAVTECKLLGIIIDQTLSWAPHVSYTAKKISQRLYQLSRIKHFVDQTSRLTFYYAYIQSLLLYCSSVWSRCCSTTLQTPESIHKSALRLVLLDSTCPSEQLYKQLDVLPLKELFLYNDLLLLYKIYYQESPSYLFNIVTPKSGPYHMRKSCLLELTHPRTNLFQSSFGYAIAQEWNSLPNNIKALNFTSYKNNLYSYLSP